MKAHRADLARTVRVLSWLLKKDVDVDGMEMYYTCTIDGPIKASKSTDLERSILQSDFKGKCHMGESLSKIFLNGPLLEKAERKALSVYVLTNGRWQNGNEDDRCGVDDFVKSVVSLFASKGARQVGYQFIRFHEKVDQELDRVGKQRLDWLDNELPQRLQSLPGLNIPPIHSDIVDTRDFDGDVGEMMEGIVSSEADNKPTR